MKVNIKKFSKMLDAVNELAVSRSISGDELLDFHNGYLKTLKREVYVVANPEMQAGWRELTDLTEAEYEMLVDILEDEA